MISNLPKAEHLRTCQELVGQQILKPLVVLILMEIRKEEIPTYVEVSIIYEQKKKDLSDDKY